MAKATFFSSPMDHFRYEYEFEYQKFLVDSLPSLSQSETGRDHQFALLQFERSVVCPPLALVVGSRLDADCHSNMCRIAFHGTLAECINHKDYETTVLPRIKVFKLKRREGLVDRVCCFCLSVLLLVADFHSSSLNRSRTVEL